MVRLQGGPGGDQFVTIDVARPGRFEVESPPPISYMRNCQINREMVSCFPSILSVWVWFANNINLINLIQPKSEASKLVNLHLPISFLIPLPGPPATVRRSGAGWP